MESRGLVHIYTGDGKGKTTAAIGLSVRAVGAGKKVMFAQFMKGMDTSELEPLRTLGIDVVRMGSVRKFIPYMTEAEKKVCHDEQYSCFDHVRKNADSYDLIIMDEIISAITTEMVPLDEVISFILGKPQKLELVLTGRQPPQDLQALADYLTDMAGVQHPYKRGIQARKGIEY
ncbi:MAG: cob(I)yrinic acid a,c-diamide adenosyltransferase [Angelakisella sp.]